MLLKSKIAKLKSIFNNNVLITEEERYCYSTDSSNILNKFNLPVAVVFVETIKQIQKVMQFASEERIPVVCRGAGTNMVGACITPKDSIVLNFSKMNKVIDFNKKNMSITVQPGVVLGDLKQLVEDNDLYFPPDPSNFKVSTIGGCIAQSSSGASAFKYGTIKDYVLSLKVVTAQGELITLGAGTIKDSVGYHLNQLMIGSEGTLGIIVEATLKLIPKPEAEKTIVSYFDSVEDAVSIVSKIVSLHIQPKSMEYMDKNSIMTVENFLHCGLDVDSECMIIVGLDGDIDLVNKQAEIVKTAMLNNNGKNVKIAQTDSEADVIWQARCSSYAASTRLAPDIISDDIIVPRDKLVEMLQKCEEVRNKYSLKMCLVSHIGDGNLHPQIVLDLNNDTELLNCKNAKEEMYETAIKLGGTFSAEHGIGIEKKKYLPRKIDTLTISYMQQIKMIFDPSNILNPGKIFEA